jgi:DNA-binding Lrp family transcriptional regulator
MYDNIDQRIINVLLTDGRASLRNIADQTDVSVTTVSNHIQDLESESILTGYQPVVNYTELGYGVTAITQVSVEGSSIEEFTEMLRDIQQIITVYQTTGEYDIHMVGKYRTTADLDDHIKELLSHDAVEDANTSVVLSTEKENEQFQLPAEE